MKKLILFAFMFCINANVKSQKMTDLIVESKINAKANKDKVLDFDKNLAKINPKLVYDNAQKKIALNDYNGAVLDYNDLVEVEPNNSKYIFERGLCKLAFTDYNGSINDFERAKLLDQSNIKVYLELSKAYNLVADYQAAVIAVDKFLAKYPLSPDALAEKGYAYLKLKNIENAEKAINMALKIDPNNLSATKTRGFIKFSKKDFSGAAIDFHKVLSSNLKVNKGELYFNKAVANFNTQNIPDACIDWKKASGLGIQPANKYINQYCN